MKVVVQCCRMALLVYRRTEGLKKEGEKGSVKGRSASKSASQQSPKYQNEFSAQTQVRADLKAMERYVLEAHANYGYDGTLEYDREFRNATLIH